jgi:hypothetical protein
LRPVYYLTCIELPQGDAAYWLDILAVHNTSAATCTQVGGLQLRVQADDALSVQIMDGASEPILLGKDALPKNMAWPSLELLEPLDGARSEQGEHQIGGYRPIEFVIPACGPVSFQYLGYISNDDPLMAWLPDYIGLTFPLFSDVSQVFLDYADPMKPEVMNRLEVETARNLHPAYIGKNTQLIFAEERFNFVQQGKGFHSILLGAGIPDWRRQIQIPHCPKTGRRMRFLCQLKRQLQHFVPRRMSDIPLLGPEQVELQDANGLNATVLRPRAQEVAFQTMNFGLDGDLLVFFEPEAMTACYFVQRPIAEPE